jgi:hypothetical protein
VDGIWSFEDLTTNITDAKETGTSLAYHQYIMSFKAVRKPGFTVIGQIFPLMLMGISSGFNFFMSAGKEVRYQLLISSLLLLCCPHVALLHFLLENS